MKPIIPQLSFSSPPLSPYGTLTGQLFLYGGGRSAFESPIFNDGMIRQNKCVLLGGLSDGLLPVPYTAKLEAVCRRCDFSLVQVITSSSYLGFGHGCLQRDTEELNQLFSYLIEHRRACHICIVGHSTGCQNAVHYLKNGHPELVARLCCVVLQAPVSDREHAELDSEVYQTNLNLAREMRARGHADEMMPRNAFWAPITAQRFLDFQEHLGADDFFSSDLSDVELKERLAHVGRVLSDNNPCHSSICSDAKRQHVRQRALVAFSGADEYVPSHVDSQMLTHRLAKAMNTDCKDESAQSVVESLFLPTANHNLSKGLGDDDTFIAAVEELMKKL